MAAPRRLHGLARLHGIQTAYHDNDGRRISASPDALMAALRALRVPLRSAADIPDLVEHRRRELWERVIPPVVTAWQGARRGGGGTVPIRLPARLRDGRVQLRAGLEEGGEREWMVSPASLPVSDHAQVDGADYVEVSAPLPALPTGYHALSAELEPHGGRGDALLISAPRRAPGWDVVADGRSWGLFAPLYALHRREPDPLAGAEIPTFYDLARLADVVADHDGAVVGTLPLLAAFLDRPYEPSPYAPVSRLFWNELYIDVGRTLDWAGVEQRESFAAWAFPGTRGTLFEREEGRIPLESLHWNDGRAVDPEAGMRLRRPVLEALADRFMRREPEPADLDAFRKRNPQVDDYARFRAVVERLGDWHGWPDRLRARDVRPEDYDEDVVRYHVFVQWLAERQLTETRERAGSRGVGLYLDLPLGVHSSGYDVWRDRPLFARDASAGAPPDPLAHGGQDWGFPPLHPEANRLDRHRYFIACIRKHLRFARVLRVDHVMQLHRMFWVVTGDARDGVYVRYPAEELYAVLCLEAQRAGAVIVGEDLGTVPREVRRGLRRHDLPGMYVAEFELRERDEDRALELKPVPADALAAVGTHDTPTFAGWWWGRDIEIRRDLGQITEEQAASELAGRAAMRRKLAVGMGVAPQADRAGEDRSRAVASEVLAAMHERMGRSAAGLVLATMEDLWLEPEPQNVPGTTGDRNWRRRMERPLEALREPDVARKLDGLNESRKGAG